MLKTTRRSISLLIILLLTVFAKMDINSEYNVPIAAYSVCAEDVDMDGFNDLIVGHKTPWQHSNPTITIMKNINNGMFEITDTSIFFCGYQQNIFAIDVNNDSSPDIVTLHSDFSSGSAVRFIRVFYNSHGTFENYSDFSLNSSATFTDILYGNVDGVDGPDIIVASNISRGWGLLYNDGFGNFSEPVYHSFTNSYPTGLACGDLNNDGRDDVVIFGAEVHLYYSTGMGLNDTVLSGSFGYGKIEDFNHDGNRDIICYNDYSSAGTGITFFENTGNGQLVKREKQMIPVSAYTAYSADFNNDGLSDILFPKDDYTGHIIYYNLGDFQFGDSIFIPVTEYGEIDRRCCCADLDGNGFTDIISVRHSYIKLPSNLDIKFNNGHGQFVDQPFGVPVISEGEISGITKVFPNPCTDRTYIEIHLSESKIVTLKVYDMSGKLINTLFDGRLSQGKSTVNWNVVTSGDESCQAGIYFVILKSNDSLFCVRKLVVNH
jgi:hypothetical protein